MPSIPLVAGNALPTLLVILKATTILIAALLVTVALQRSSASARHQVWLVALAGLIALPIIATFVPIGVRVLPARIAIASSGTINTAADRGVTPTADGVPTAAATDPAANDATDATVPRGIAEAVTARAIPLGPLFFGAWALVAAVLLGRLLLGMLAVRRIVRGAVPLEDPTWRESLYEIADRLGLDDAPALLRSEAIPVPFAAGLRHALIVLPGDADEWSAAKREAVLIHELGHVRRHDMIGHTLGRIACALYWFHPLVWTAARRLRDASERACDDLAIRLGTIPSDYAQHLLDIVTKVRNPATPTAAIAMARRKEFEGRMLAILDPALHRGEPSRGRTALLSIALAGFVFAVSAAAPAPREAQSPPTAELTRPSPELPVTLPEATPAAATAELNPSSPQKPVETLTQPESSVSATDDSQGLPDVMQQLIERLGQDSSAEVRRVAAWGLQRYADEPAAQAALAKALAGDADADVRKMAAWSLAHTRADVALAAIRTALAADRDDGVREMAVWGLGTHGDATSAAAISRALGSEQSDDVRGTAAWAVGRLKPDRAPAGLVALLDSPNSETRLKAAWALSEIGDSTALPALQAAIEKNPGDGTMTRALLRALVRSGSSEASLSRFLSSANPEVRLYAIKAMAGGGSTLDPWPWPWPRPMPSF